MRKKHRRSEHGRADTTIGGPVFWLVSVDALLMRSNRSLQYLFARWALNWLGTRPTHDMTDSRGMPTNQAITPPERDTITRDGKSEQHPRRFDRKRRLWLPRFRLVDETEIWKGTDPTPTTAQMGNSLFKIRLSVVSRRPKIYLDSKAVAGWNEIDAVAMFGRAGNVQWASDAWASTAYGENQTLPKWFWP